MITWVYLICVVFVHEHLISKYVDVYETGNRREVTNAEPETESVLLPVNESNVELLVDETGKAIVLEADKVLLVVDSDEEDADANTKLVLVSVP